MPGAMTTCDSKRVQITLTLETSHLDKWRQFAAELGCESLEQFVGFTVDNKAIALSMRDDERRAAADVPVERDPSDVAS